MILTLVGVGIFIGGFLSALSHREPNSHIAVGLLGVAVVFGGALIGFLAPHLVWLP